MKKSFFCQRLTDESMNAINGGLADASRGGTDLGGPTSGGVSGSQYCVCVCACANEIELPD